jgi:hypothetical protein
VLASTRRGARILNRFGDRETTFGRGIGVAVMLLTNSRYEPDETATIATLLDTRRKHFGGSANVLDVGANIGVFAVEWARHMAGWVRILAFEAQERIVIRWLEMSRLITAPTPAHSGPRSRASQA